MENQDEITSYHFQILKSSWGIAIDIDGFKEPVIKRARIGEYPITEMIWLTIRQDIQLTDSELWFINNGIKDVADKIEVNIYLPIKIVLIRIDRSICDYQEEGLYYAMRGWAAKHFGFEEEEVSVHFDSKQNKYIFPGLKLK